MGVAVAPNQPPTVYYVWRQVFAPGGHADGGPRTPASPTSPASPPPSPAAPSSGAILPRAVLRVRTASRELHDLRGFEHDEVRRVRSKAILLDRLSATDHIGSGSQVRGPRDYHSPHPNTNLPNYQSTS